MKITFKNLTDNQVGNIVLGCFGVSLIVALVLGFFI
jgi:hypothetical protein